MIGALGSMGSLGSLGLTNPLNKGGGVPAGFVPLLDIDGSPLFDLDGRILYEAA